MGRFLKLYLARHKSGYWFVVPRAKATIPPFIDVKGPFDVLEARWLCARTNWEKGYRRKKKNSPRERTLGG
jgi:hypothetical protein